MTDYSSQGKTRPQNLVDLNNCCSHQSYYTALSRSGSATGTCITQGFDSRMITGGASGALWQEFHELELLDDIVCLRYKGKLAETVVGDRRQNLIQKFREWKGEKYVPPHLHKAIRWGKSDLFQMDESVEDVSWHIVKNSNKPNGAQKKKTGLSNAHVHKSSSQHASKRELSPSDSSVLQTTAKKMKTTHYADDSSAIAVLELRGPRWSDNSCAYDSVLSVLYTICLSDPEQTGSYNKLGNIVLNALIDKCAEHIDRRCSLEDVRDFLRQTLQREWPTEFPAGTYVSVHSVFDRLLSTRRAILSSALFCPNDHQCPNRRSFLKNCLIPVAANFSGTMQDWIDCLEAQQAARCEFCNAEFIRRYSFQRDSPILAFDVSDVDVDPDRSLTVTVHDKDFQYRLHSIVYFGGGHFVSRVVTADGQVWFHDGIATGNSMFYDGTLESCNLKVCRLKSPIVLVYTLQP
jgi:hypothetical protein